MTTRCQSLLVKRIRDHVDKKPYAAPATGTETDAICLLAVALLAEIESKLEGLRGCAQEDARSEERVCEMHS